MGYVFFLVCTMYVCSLLCSLVVFPVSCWEFSREFLSRGGVKSAREGGRGGGGREVEKIRCQKNQSGVGCRLYLPLPFLVPLFVPPLTMMWWHR